MFTHYSGIHQVQGKGFPVTPHVPQQAESHLCVAKSPLIHLFQCHSGILHIAGFQERIHGQ